MRVFCGFAFSLKTPGRTSPTWFCAAHVYVEQRSKTPRPCRQFGDRPPPSRFFYATQCVHQLPAPINGSVDVRAPLKCVPLSGWAQWTVPGWGVTGSHVGRGSQDRSAGRPQATPLLMIDHDCLYAEVVKNIGSRVRLKANDLRQRICGHAVGRDDAPERQIKKRSAGCPPALG